MFLLQALAVMAALYALLAGRALLRLRGLGFHCPETRFSGLDEITPAERAVLDVPRAWLRAEGFRHVAWLRSADLLQPEGQPRPVRAEALHVSSDGRIRCTVAIAPVPFHGIPHALRFESSLADGRELITVNRAGPLPMPPAVALEDAYAGSDDAALAHHRARLGEQACVVFPDLEAALAHHNRVGAEVFAWWRRTWLEPAGERWRLTWRGAWQCFGVVQRHQSRLKKVVPVPAPAPAPGAVPSAAPAAMATTAATPVAGSVHAAPDRAALDHAEAAMLAQQLDIEASAGSAGKAKWRSFALTALGFLVLGKLFFGGGWSFIVLLMAVLLLHELGHYLAMRAFGFRDLSIFFLPLLGAAAKGHNDSAPPWQQVVVLLAGPLPGLLLGLVTLFLIYGNAGVPGSDLPPAAMGALAEFAAIALVINGLNLLPIQPLDGGRVAELLFFSRFPRASVGFFIAGVAVLLALAAAFTDPVLAVLGVLLALSLPYQWRLAGLSRALQPQFGAARDRGDALRRLAQTYNAGPARDWPALTRVNLARALLPRLQGGLPGLPTVAIGGAIYLGLIASPLLLLLSLGPQALRSPEDALASLASAPMSAGMERRLETRLAEAKTVEEVIKARIMLHYHYQNPLPGQAGPASAARAREHLDAAWALLPRDNPLRLGNAAWGLMHAYLADLAGRDAAAARRLHAELLAAIRAHGGVADQARWLAEREALLLAAKAPLAERLAHHEEVEALWAREASLGHALQSEPLDREAANARHYARSGVVMARRARALLLWEAGRGAEALPLLARNHEEIGALSGDEYRALRDHTLADLAWLQVALGQPAQAVPLFAQFTPRADRFMDYEDDPWMMPPPEQAHAWAALQAGDAATALRASEAAADAAHRADPGQQMPTVPLALALDRLLAQQRLGDAGGIARTQAEIAALMKKMGDPRWAASAITAADVPGNLAAARARAHRDLLATLGYAMTPPR